MTTTTSSTHGHPSFQGLIGAAQRDITPPAGIYARSWGAAKHDVHDGVHRPLTCTAVVLRAGENDLPLALIALDLGWWKRAEDEWLVRGAVIAALGVDDARVIVTMAHTHAGPSIDRSDHDRPGGHLVAAYLEQVRDAAVAAATEALRTACPAELAWEYGHCALARNRDLPDPLKPRTLCGFNPDLPADDTLLVGRATRTDGTIVATIVNYACHPTTLAWENHLISPDYVGAMRATVQAGTGGAPCAFLLGACGDLGPREQYTGDTSVADRNGAYLGACALATLVGMLPPRTRLAFSGAIESGAPLAAWRSEPTQPARTIGASTFAIEHPLKPLPSVAEITDELARCTDPVLIERLRRKLGVRRAVGDGSTAPIRGWVWRLGDAVLLAHPHEAYSLLQTELRARTPSRAIAVMNLSNGTSVGYLPPAALYDRDLYQVWQTPYAREVLERFTDACASAIDRTFSTSTAMNGSNA
ncbi:MAG: hypothetical protein H0V44_14390 [Planctomycetes bacterium]|nr:hypothetical protein [Planctomycetota bacterium]